MTVSNAAEERIAEILRLKPIIAPAAWAALRRLAPLHLGQFNDHGLGADSIVGTMGFIEALEGSGLTRVDGRLGSRDSAAEAALLEILSDWCSRGILRTRHAMHREVWEQRYYVTSYGYTCAMSEEPDHVPDDPIGYLAAIEGRTGPLDPTLRGYLAEALSCFGGRTYFAALVMLGCAAERLYHQLNGALPVPKEGKPGRTVGKVLGAIEQELVAKGAQLHETDEEHWRGRLDAGLGILRASRNEAGHPHLVRAVDRFHVRERFLTFAVCVETAYALLAVL